jgi:hypothetical protein
MYRVLADHAGNLNVVICTQGVRRFAFLPNRFAGDLLERSGFILGDGIVVPLHLEPGASASA